MAALIVGIVCIVISAVAGYAWWSDVLQFIRGALPVMALFIGLLAAFIGIADLKDRAAAKKEEEEEKKAEADVSAAAPKA